MNEFIASWSLKVDNTPHLLGFPVRLSMNLMINAVIRRIVDKLCEQLVKTTCFLCDRHHVDFPNILSLFIHLFGDMRAMSSCQFSGLCSHFGPSLQSSLRSSLLPLLPISVFSATVSSGLPILHLVVFILAMSPTPKIR